MLASGDRDGQIEGGGGGVSCKAGADFIVAPIVNPAVAAVAKEAGLLWMPGCMTPTEIYLAQQLEAAVIKLFPANILKPEFLRSILYAFHRAAIHSYGRRGDR